MKTTLELHVFDNETKAAIQDTIDCFSAYIHIQNEGTEERSEKIRNVLRHMASQTNQMVDSVLNQQERQKIADGEPVFPIIQHKLQAGLKK